MYNSERKTYFNTFLNDENSYCDLYMHKGGCLFKKKKIMMLLCNIRTEKKVIPIRIMKPMKTGALK